MLDVLTIGQMRDRHWYTKLNLGIFLFLVTQGA